MNIDFQYLYRDGANYKQYYSEIFSNKNRLPILKIDDLIRSVLIDEEWFYPGNWKLKDMHAYKWDNEIDHPWHEYAGITETQKHVTNGDISDFMQLITSNNIAQ